jgi:hypothetical protein
VSKKYALPLIISDPMKFNNDINISIRIFILLFIFEFVIAFYFLAFEGLLMSDDFTYSYYGYQFLQGNLKPDNDIFIHRFGVFIPLSIIYFIFGINDITTTIWPLLAFLLTGWLVYKYFPDSEKSSGIYALIFSMLSFYPLFFSNKLFPDVIVSFFCIASAYIVSNRSEGRSILFPLLFSICIFIGFLTKETIIYILPFYMLIVIHDLIKKKKYFFWCVASFSLLTFALLYFIIYKYYTGDFFYRFNVIQEGHYVSGHSYYDKPFIDMLKRITYEPLLFFISTEFIIPIVFALPVIFSIKWKSLNELDNRDSYWTIFFIVLILMFWFGSTSYKFYNPISLNGRMYIITVPVLAILVGLSLPKIERNLRWYLWFALCFAMAVVYTYFSENVKLSFIYSLLVFYSLVSYYIKRSLQFKYRSEVVVLFLVGILVIHPAFSMCKSDRDTNKDSRYVVTNFLNDAEGKMVVLTDPLQINAAIYYSKFDPDKSYQYLNYKNVNLIKNINADKCYILINKKNIQELSSMGYRIPEYFNKPFPQWKLVVKRGNVLLYEITDVNKL